MADLTKRSSHIDCCPAIFTNVYRVCSYSLLMLACPYFLSFNLQYRRFFLDRTQLSSLVKGNPYHCNNSDNYCYNNYQFRRVHTPVILRRRRNRRRNILRFHYPGITSQANKTNIQAKIVFIDIITPLKNQI